MSANYDALSKEEKKKFDSDGGRKIVNDYYVECKKDQEVMKAANNHDKCALAYEACASKWKADYDRNFTCVLGRQHMELNCKAGSGEGEKKHCDYFKRCTGDGKVREAGNDQSKCLAAYKGCAKTKIAYDAAFDCATHSADMEGKCLEEAGTNQDTKKRCNYYIKCTADDKVKSAKKEQTKCLKEYGKCAEKKEAEGKTTKADNEKTTTSKGADVGLGSGFLVSTAALLFLLH
jgi:hypothetical protein